MSRNTDLEASPRDLGALVRLAGPVVIAELGWNAMWLVDTMVVGRVGPEAIGAVSIGSHLFFVVAMFGLGLLLGMDYLVARAFGAGRMADMHRTLVHGIVLSVGLSILLTGGMFAIIPMLGVWGVNPVVLKPATGYAYAVAWSLLPFFLFTAIRRYLQAIGAVTAIMLTLLSANIVNLAANWVLVFGHLGFPALGAEGSGWATCIARAYMFLVLVGVLFVRERDSLGAILRIFGEIQWTELRKIIRLGLPAGIQITLEVGVFGFATALAGRLDPTSIAAHQIALSCAATTFMVPLGVSSAAAVRVGQRLGAGDIEGARRAGWNAFALAAGFMLIAVALFVVFPGPILSAFTSDPHVLTAGITLLGVAAVFQLFDGIQVVATGVLRGIGETRLPMIANLFGHWAIGLPVGAFLCFERGWGVTGLWVGLCVGLIVVSVVLALVWARRSHQLGAPLNHASSSMS